MSWLRGRVSKDEALAEIVRLASLELDQYADEAGEVWVDISCNLDIVIQRVSDMEEIDAK